MLSDNTLDHIEASLGRVLAAVETLELAANSLTKDSFSAQEKSDRTTEMVAELVSTLVADRLEAARKLEAQMLALASDLGLIADE